MVSASTTYRIAQRRPALLHAQAQLSDEPPGVLNSILILTAQGLKPLHSHLELIQAVPVAIFLAPCLGQPESKRPHGPWTATRKRRMSFFEVSTVINHNRQGDFDWPMARWCKPNGGMQATALLSPPFISQRMSQAVLAPLAARPAELVPTEESETSGGNAF